MEVTFRAYTGEDLPELMEIWNDILEDGEAFPGTELYVLPEFAAMLEEQSAVTCMLQDGVLAGYYILHPNNIGRCSHVANASYAMKKEFRGRGLGKYLVGQSLKQAARLGFRGMQFNAVVAGNLAALRIYRNAGFQTVGKIPGGFLLKNGTYSDMYILYRPLTESGIEMPSDSC